MMRKSHLDRFEIITIQLNSEAELVIARTAVSVVTALNTCGVDLRFVRKIFGPEVYLHLWA
jgi:hypothetical protein